MRYALLLVCLFSYACSPKLAPMPVVTATPTAPSDMDVEMESAFREARGSLDTFIQKIATPHADQTFVAVKVRFYLPDASSQDIWVDEVTYKDGVFRGLMGDDIPSLRLEAGEKITVKKEDILDWMIVEDGKLVGGYTIRLAVKRMSPEEKERFFETLDYAMEE